MNIAKINEAQIEKLLSLYDARKKEVHADRYDLIRFLYSDMWVSAEAISHFKSKYFDVSTLALSTIKQYSSKGDEGYIYELCPIRKTLRDIENYFLEKEKQEKEQKQLQERLNQEIKDLKREKRINLLFDYQNALETDFEKHNYLAYVMAMIDYDNNFQCFKIGETGNKSVIDRAKKINYEQKQNWYYTNRGAYRAIPLLAFPCNSRAESLLLESYLRVLFEQEGGTRCVGKSKSKPSKDYFEGIPLRFYFLKRIKEKVNIFQKNILNN